MNTRVVVVFSLLLLLLWVKASAASPLALVADLPLPGGATRYDYQAVDGAHGLLVLTHMNDHAVEILDLKDGKLLKRLTGIATPRGVVTAPEANLIFVTSKPGQLVLIDSKSLREVSRVKTGIAPDGDAWDPIDKIVAVSDEHGGAISLFADAGRGAHTQVPLGVETGNVAFDAARGRFWITVVGKSLPDQLIALDAKSGKVVTRIAVPDCSRAHGLLLHPDGKSAFVACENNDRVLRVELEGAHAISSAPVGNHPDVLAVDAGIGWLYVAPEAGDVMIFDINRPGLVTIGHEHPGDNAHSVAVDPVTHRVFFPIMRGPAGTPLLRIMKPQVR